MTDVYAIRVSLDDVRPAVWRRVRIRGDALLPELHELIQDAMGWEDRHLFMFFTGPDIRTAERRYEMAEYAEEYDDASVRPADDVRLDQVLQNVGDSIGYEYDFGDGWGHRLVVENVEPDDGSAPSECVGGRRACPPEDSGGPHGFEELLRSAQDEDDPEHEHLVRWLGSYDRDYFDVADANARITTRRRRAAVATRIALQFPVVASVVTGSELSRHERLADMLATLEPEKAPVDPLVASAAMEKLTWMLGAIGDDGIALTAAGYLPPKVVAAMRDEVTWPHQWLGNSTREIDNPEPHRLRHAMTSLGLARVLKGRFILTRDGRKVADDAVALWHHAARRLPIGREDYERDAGMLLMVAVAANAPAPQRNVMMWESMQVMGWRIPPSQRNRLQYVARPTLDVLELVGAVAPYFGTDGATGQSWGPDFAMRCLMA